MLSLCPWNAADDAEDTNAVGAPMSLPLIGLPNPQDNSQVGSIREGDSSSSRQLANYIHDSSWNPREIRHKGPGQSPGSTSPSSHGNSNQGRRFAGTLDVLDLPFVIRNRKLLCMLFSNLELNILLFVVFYHDFVTVMFVCHLS